MKNKLTELLRNNSKILLTGPAGSGKTYLIKEFVKTLPKIKILILAPTHKALDVIKNKFSDEKVESNLTFKTIHSALNIKPVIVGDKRVFLPAKNSHKALNKYNLIIIDEASMIDKIMLKSILKTTTKTIFVGDEKQLPPVGMDYSPAFKEKIPKIKLTKIYRQAENNPITLISKNPTNFFSLLSDGKNIINEETGIAFCKDKEFILEQMAKINDPNKLVFLAYRNETIDNFNTAVKKRLGIIEQVTSETPILIKKPYKKTPGSTIIHPKKIEKKVYKEYIFNRKTKQVDKIPINYLLVNGVYKLVAESSLKDWYKVLFIKKKRSIEEYLRLVDYFTDWSYAWGLTVHKSQGSSFKNVIVDLPDILKSDNSIKNKLLYTALTRATNLNIIII